MIRLGEAAEAFDPKLDAIMREVRAIRAEHPATNILIYTEYADSQLVVLRALRGAVEGEVLAISGLDSETRPDADRGTICRGGRHHPDQHRTRWLRGSTCSSAVAT